VLFANHGNAVVCIRPASGSASGVQTGRCRSLSRVRWVPAALTERVMRPRRVSDHSHPPSAEVKMSEVLLLLSYTSLRRGHRDNSLIPSKPLHFTFRYET
jgi:hypothetical protein